MTRLTVIKIAHTLIWLFFNVVIVYLVYAVVSNRIDKFVWIAIGLIGLEGLVLLLFKGICPLTLVASKYSDSVKDNFDIYLPNWLAHYNKLIYTTIVVLTLCLLTYRLVSR